MNKQDFLTISRKGLSGLPKDEIEERLSFYSEIIDDRMEEGLSEEDSIRDLGTTDEIISQIVSDIPLSKIVKEKIKPKKKLKTWETILLILGSPIWASLLIAAAAVIFSLYVASWALIISLWAVFVSFGASFLGGIIGGIILALNGNISTGIALISAGIVCAGLCIFAFFGCKAATKGILIFTKNIAFLIKNRFIKKEEV